MNELNPIDHRILLITPPSIFLLDQRVFINLGILKIGAVVRAAGARVTHLDLSGEQDFITVTANHIKSSDINIIAITTTTPQLPAVTKIVKQIRETRPDVKIILGGPHVTLTDSAVKLEKRAGRVSRAHVAMEGLQGLADVLVSGDGELAVFEALKPGAPKLIDGDDPQGGLFMSNKIYDASPYPARDLVDVMSYHYTIDGRRSTSLIGQLGCPFACGFCGGRNSKSLRVIRTRTIESIITEMRMLYQTYGFTGFMFYDDELNVNREMIKLMNALADLQSELGVDFRLRGFVKSQLFNDDQAKAMYRAGFRWVLSGFESGAPRILDNMNKKATVEHNTRTMEISDRAGLKVKALMSVGHPGESPESVEQSQAWLMKVKPADFDCTVITTYPGTPYYDEAVPHPTEKGVWTYTLEKNGDRLHAYEIDFLTTADYYKGDPNGGYQSYVFTDALSAKQIVESRNWIERSVRDALHIPYPQAAHVKNYEHSMGQGANEIAKRII